MNADRPWTSYPKEIPPLRLDVVVPTFNRSGLLQKTLASLSAARVPEGLQVGVIVVDNNSVDDTRETVEKLVMSFPLPLRYVLEPMQGSSHTRNRGIGESDADLIGFIDDDEQVDEAWFEVVQREFADPTIRFIGGPYLPHWVSPVPDWLPPGYHAAIGAILPKPRALFGDELRANLMGGNAVLRRQIFSEIGTYSTRLGRSSKGLLSEEDAEFLRRLLAAKVRGVYVPDLIIHHYIAPERLTRKYHRSWVFWRGISQGVLDREQKEPVSYFARIPRYKFGRAVRSLLLWPLHRLRPNGKGRAFADELDSWDLAGFAYGKFFFKPETYYAKSGKR